MLNCPGCLNVGCVKCGARRKDTSWMVSIPASMIEVDRNAAILNLMAEFIDQDKNRLTNEAKQALARVNAAVARQDRRFNK